MRGSPPAGSPRDEVTLTVLGSCGGWPEPGRACSGYLVQAGPAAVVVDLGYGTLAPLLSVLGDDLTSIMAVVVTHAHPDHVSDLSGLARVLRHHEAGAIPLLAPAQVLEVLRSSEPEDGESATAAFSWLSLPGRHVVGDIVVHGVETPHWLPHAAVRIELSGQSLTWTGDGGSSASLVSLAAGTDLLVCGATERHEAGSAPSDEDSRFLMDGTGAGLLALQADAAALLLTHFWPGSDRALTASRASRVFSGPIQLATEGLRLRI